MRAVFARFRVVSSEQVLKHLTEQFGIKRDFLLYGCVLLHCELIMVPNRGDQPVGTKKQAVGDGIVAALGGVVGKAVQTSATCLDAFKAVKTVKQAAVDEGRLVEQFDQAVGILNLFPVSVHGKDCGGRHGSVC